jgi:CysZ protein
LIHLLPIVGWVLAPAYAVIAATMSMYEINKLVPEKGLKDHEFKRNFYEPD